MSAYRVTPPHPASFETARVWCPDCRRSIDCCPDDRFLLVGSEFGYNYAGRPPCPYCGSRDPKLERDPMPPWPQPVTTYRQTDEFDPFPGGPGFITPGRHT